ncbi:hypothetical protein I3843_14G120000 [Carya illinoinensis]|nr:hypothetical protein I3843_14G120000 [Carya illinoinensis]
MRRARLGLSLRPMSSSPILSHLPFLSPPRITLVKHHVLPSRHLTTTRILFFLPISPRPLSPSSSFSSSTVVPRISLSSKCFDVDLEPYLSCSMPNKRLRVAVLLSGGVDSSVALRLLHAAGHECTAFYLKIWFQEDFENFWSECPWEEDLKYAQAVCNQVDIPLEVVHLTDEYWKNVVSYIIEEYRCGRTPNPDVLCNTRIKFGAFMDAISSMQFDYVASGHYANIVHSSTDQIDRPSVLELSKDMDKVRKLATKFDLPNKDRKDSQGICFLGKIKFSEFVARHIGEKEGVILEAETGDFLGKHPGFWFYTIGQRQGLRLPGGPWYVVEKDVKNNVVFVSRNYFSIDKRRRIFRVGSLKWLDGLLPNQLHQLQCKVRHGPGFYNCSLTMELGQDGCEDIAVVQLSGDDQGLAAGQFAAFYDGRVCLGSGIILESWDDQGFPVCAKALQIAGIKDKSKLGKPIKIKDKPETPLAVSDQKDGPNVYTLQNSYVAAIKQRRHSSKEEPISRFPVNWLQKIREKWMRIF